MNYKALFWCGVKKNTKQIKQINIMRSTDEIYNEIDRATEKQYSGEGFHGMTYEDGVKAALEWAMGDVEDKPMDD